MSESLPTFLDNVFCMERLLPPFAYLDRRIIPEDEYSPTWAMAWALFYMARKEKIPEYVRIMVFETAELHKKELNILTGEWNNIVQQGAVEIFGIAYSNIEFLMANSPGFEIPFGESSLSQIAESMVVDRIKTLNQGLGILNEKMPVFPIEKSTSVVGW